MYNLDSLVDYFISTGDFLEPETRLPFSDEELRTIDMKVGARGFVFLRLIVLARAQGYAVWLAKTVQGCVRHLLAFS